MPSAHRERRRVTWWVALPAALALMAVVLGLLLLVAWLRLLPDALDPFGTRTEDRTGPALLESIQDMSRYEAASGNFQVVVDLDKDAKFLPDAVRGSRTLFVGAGTVGAHVDLGGLGEDAVTVTEDRKSATVTLPRARLGRAALDADRSYAVAKERGLLDRLGDVFSDNPNDEREVHRLAVRHIEEAARESDLTDRAERNTRTMLENLIRSLGYERITVRFAPPSG
ncbi:DUF4230 domain-containing protein [Streptomyces sp. URMC 123]|uniref:DUF4230 domain-containing protein n=1 Tax=Streptomyces sp. URMC 123 TaxID=3423403 RepID=UPI003F1AAC79